MSAISEKIAQAVQSRKAPEAPEHEPHVEVVIIGSGFGGIGAAIELKRHGVEDFIIIDKNEDIGGTWHANTYPGVAVDIPSLYYSFSYEPPERWTRFFAKGAEVKAYADQLVEKYDLRKHILLGAKVLAGRWDEDDHVWVGSGIDERTGEELSIRSRYVIGAIGGIEVPNMPDIAGIETFAGKVLHTAKWDHDYSCLGKRVGVIGTGASALQLIPELAKKAHQLTVFQRTPIWVGPKPDFPIPHWFNTVLARVPGLRRLIRGAIVAGIDLALIAGAAYKSAPWLVEAASAAARLYYRFVIRDKDLREKLTPKYALGCKRPSVSNEYLKTFTKPDVALITEPIARITSNSVVTADGTQHAIDTLVCATGFKVGRRESSPPIPLAGRGGVDLGQWWEENGLQAYQGVSVPGFPNFFTIIGPYGFPAGSYIAMIECTARHAARAIAEARKRAAISVEIRQEPHDRYFALCKKRNEGSMWVSASCAGSNTYYIDYQGNPALRQSTHFGMWKGNKHFPLEDYRYTTRSLSGGAEETPRHTHQSASA